MCHWAGVRPGNIPSARSLVLCILHQLLGVRWGRGLTWGGVCCDMSELGVCDVRCSALQVAAHLVTFLDHFPFLSGPAQLTSAVVEHSSLNRHGNELSESILSSPKLQVSAPPAHSKSSWATSTTPWATRSSSWATSTSPWASCNPFIAPCPHTLPSHPALTPCPHPALTPCPHPALTPCPQTLPSHPALTPCPHTLPSPCPHTP